MNSDIHFTEEDFELAERYLLGQMPAAEKRLFEEKMAADAKLKEAVARLQLEILGVQEAALSKMLNRFHEELPVQEKTEPAIVKWFSRKRWLAAACVIFVLLAGCWFFIFRKTENEKLYATYFSPDPGLMTTMGTTDNYTFDRAMVDYKTGHYAEAIGAWMELLKDSPQNDTLNYFIGVAFIADKNTLGGTYLEKVIAMPESKFVEDAYWYQGLNLLKTSKLKETVAEYIRRSNHPQKEALLKELKK